MSLLNSESAPTGQSETTPPAGNSPTQTTAPTETKSWHESLPEDMRADATLKNFKDVASLAKSYLSAQSMIGKKGVVLPAENASDDEMQAFYKNLGRPDMDKYTLEAPKDYEMPEATAAQLKELFFKQGVMPKQAKGILDGYSKIQAALVTEYQAKVTSQREEALGGLRKEWGNGFEKEVAYAKVAAKEFGGDEFIAALDKRGWGDDPLIIKTLAKAGKLLGEDRIRGESSGSFGQTPAEIIKEHEELQGKMFSMNTRDPQYAFVQKQVMELAQKRYGN